MRDDAHPPDAGVDAAAVRGLLDALPVAVLVFDAMGWPRRSNRVARELLTDLVGLPLEQWPGSGRLLAEDGSPLDAAALAPLATLEDGTGRQEVEVRVKAEDGSVVPVLLSTEPVLDPGGCVQQVNCVFMPVPVRAGREAKARFELQMKTLASASAGLAGPFHDALTAITGYCDLALAHLGPSDWLLGPLGEIRRATERATALAQRLVAQAQAEVPALLPVDLHAWLLTRQAHLRAALGDHIDLEVEAACEGARVRADPRLVEQVLLHLVANAREAMPTGGSLVVDVRRVEIGEADVARYGGVPEGRYAALGVSDTGCGVPCEHVPRLFEPFFSTRRGSLGLGLATVERLVTSLEGRVHVESRPGRGTSVRVFLPLLEETGAREEEQPAGTGRRPAGPPRILVVEDDPVVRDLMRQILEADGYRIQTAHTAVAALRLVAQAEKDLDLLVSDLMLPGTDGHAMARRLRALRPDLPILFVSGCQNPTLVGNALRETDTAFLAKPFDPATLLAHVRRLVGVATPPQDQPPSARATDSAKPTAQPTVK